MQNYVGMITFHMGTFLSQEFVSYKQILLFRENSPKCQIVFEVLNTPLQRFFKFFIKALLSGDREMFKNELGLEAINSY